MGWRDAWMGIAAGYWWLAVVEWVSVAYWWLGEVALPVARHETYLRWWRGLGSVLVDAGFPIKDIGMVRWLQMLAVVAGGPLGDRRNEETYSKCAAGVR